MVGIAVVTIIARKKTQTRQGLWGLLHYCMQDKKTVYNGRKLVTGVNCVAQSAFNEMANTKLQYRKPGGRQYYHIMQAFHPDEPITPETAHEIALRFAEENFPGYEVLVATHVDRHHIHSHFVLNSVNAETGLKFHSGNHEIQRLRDASDRLCISMGKRNTTVSYEYRGTDLAFHATFDTITIAVDERQQKHPSFSF